MRADGSVPAPLDEQADAAFANLRACLAAHGLGLEAVVKLSTFVMAGQDLRVVRAARERHFGSHRPTATLVLVAGLADPGLRRSRPIRGGRGSRRGARTANAAAACANDAQRTFFVTMLLSAGLACTRSQPGTTTLRALTYRPAVLVAGEVRYARARLGVDETRPVQVMVPLDDGPMAFSFDRTEGVDLPLDALASEPVAGAVFALRLGCQVD